MKLFTLLKSFVLNTDIFRLLSAHDLLQVGPNVCYYEEDVWHKQLNQGQDYHRPRSSDFGWNVRLEVCKHDLVIGNNEEHALIEHLEFIDFTVKEGVEVHQVKNESKTQPDVCEDL